VKGVATNTSLSWWICFEWSQCCHEHITAPTLTTLLICLLHTLLKSCVLKGAASKQSRRLRRHKCCSELQCVAVCGRVLPCITANPYDIAYMCITYATKTKLNCVHALKGVVAAGPNNQDAYDDPIVAVCCSMLQCVAKCCRVLPCVAVCCSRQCAVKKATPCSLLPLSPPLQPNTQIHTHTETNTSTHTYTHTATHALHLTYYTHAETLLCTQKHVLGSHTPTRTHTRTNTHRKCSEAPVLIDYKLKWRKWMRTATIEQQEVTCIKIIIVCVCSGWRELYICIYMYIYTCIYICV